MAFKMKGFSYPGKSPIKHEASTNEHASMGDFSEHWKNEHSEGDTSESGNQQFGADAGTPGENMEWGVGFNMGGPGLGIKTPHGSFNMLPEKPKNFKEAGMILLGPLGGKFGTAGKKALKGIGDKAGKWFT